MFEFAFWVLPGMALVVAAFLCWRFLDPSSVLHVLDRPGDRSLHQVAVPRSGGVAVLAGLLLALVTGHTLGWLEANPQWLAVWAAVAALAVIGLVDDYRDLSPLMRLLVQAGIALGLVAMGFRVHTLWLPGLGVAMPSVVSLLFSALFILWLINLYNFMDGMDGLAACMAVLGFGAYGWLGWLAEEYTFALLSWVIVGAVAGFLLFNFPPARIFMGDAGAPVLGLLVAVFSLWADAEGLFPLWLGALIFSLFIVDATFTLLYRLWRGEKIWQAHREHLYQRLVLRGWSHRKTLFWAYLLMTANIGTALLVWNAGMQAQWAALAGWGAIYALLIVIIGFRKI